MTDKVFAFITQHHMIQPGDHVICAVSGGKDSMALLDVLCQLAPKLHCHISVAHFNHLLRGTESDQDCSFVSAWCHAHAIPFYTASADVRHYAQQSHLGIEDAARRLRYEFLTSIDACAKIATAHTADDNLETVLMHLIRGSGLHGLTGIPPVRGQIIRPLLTLSSVEILDYLTSNNIPHIEDSTNALDDCTRNRLRHHIIPQLKSENPDFLSRINEMTASLLDDDIFLETQAQAALDRIRLSPTSISTDGLCQLSPALQARVCRLFLKVVPALTYRQTQQIIALSSSSSPSATISLPGGYLVRRCYSALELSFPARHATFSAGSTTLNLNGNTSFGSYLISVTAGTCHYPLPPYTVALNIKPDCRLLVRTRQPGDRICLPGGTKKLSRLMIDHKLPAHLRSSYPILTDGQNILALLPYCVARDYRVSDGAECYLITLIGLEE